MILIERAGKQVQTTGNNYMHVEKAGVRGRTHVSSGVQ